MLIEELKQFISINNLFGKKEKLLVAVSGGVDSMVLAHCLVQLKYKVVVAHCNFKLRGLAADKDELFVEKFAKANKLQFISKSFNTKAYSKKNKISVQEAAREMRYYWFKELCDSGIADSIVTAHHKNDVAETLLFNIARGTGLAGLHGIKAKHDNITRPFLFCEKQSLLHYAKENNIVYREDNSNSENKYSRNFIRNNVIALLQKINPAAVDNICRLTGFVSQAEYALEELKERYLHDVLIVSGSTLKIDIPALLKKKNISWFIHAFFSTYGFNSEQTVNIINLLQGQTGKKISSASYELYKDRNYLVLVPMEKHNNNEAFHVSKKDTVVNVSEKQLTFKIIKNNSRTDFRRTTSQFFDADKLQFPLLLRKWKSGDRLHPIGMDGTKKVSDLLIDLKMPLHKKSNVLVLQTGADIAAVIGIRIDNQYKITESTKYILELNIQED